MAFPDTNTKALLGKLTKLGGHHTKICIVLIRVHFPGKMIQI